MQRGPSASHKNIAIVGTGISGMSAAWLLSERHRVTVYEAEHRLGGHQTVTVPAPKRADSRGHGLHRLQRDQLSQPHRVVRTSRRADAVSDMSFAVSLATAPWNTAATPVGLFAQPSNLFAPGSG